MELPSNRSLCAKCQQLTARISTTTTPPLNNLRWTWAELLESKSNCPLCCILYDRAPNVLSDYALPPGKVTLGALITFEIDDEHNGNKSITKWQSKLRCSPLECGHIQSRIHEHRLAGFAVCKSAEGGPLYAPVGQVDLDARLPSIKYLIEECRSNHPECQKYNEYIPTRLIQISPREHGSLRTRLVDRGQYGADAVYATLSYRWGDKDKRPYMTTKDNFHEHKYQIPWDKLTSSVQDAMTLVHALGYQYIWIDSLCIVQDNAADWQREAAEMAYIFHGSDLTILAADAESARDYLPLSVSGPQIFDEVTDIAVRWPSTNSNGHLARCSLYTRGWVFQELLLSRRRLNLRSDQFYWHCLRLLTSEDGTWSHHGKTIHPAITAMSEVPDWHVLVSDYTAADFSIVTDRVPALIGPIEWFAVQSGNTPVLGLWKETLSTDLTWRFARKKSQIKPLPGCPSWSWLAVDAYIVWSDRDFTPLLDIIHCEVTWRGAPLVSPLDSASLRVSGRSVPINLDVSEKDPTEITLAGSASLRPVVLVDDLAGLPFTQDDLDKLSPCRLLLCGRQNWEIASAEEGGESLWMQHFAGLLLQRVVDEGHGVGYRRIGSVLVYVDCDAKTTVAQWPDGWPEFEMVEIDLV